jgi:glutathione S-transferase
MAVFSFLLSLSLALPTWTTLESQLPTASPPPVYKDKLPETFDDKQRLVLYRDEQGLCPYSQQVWLALELKGVVDYVTVLTSGEETPKLQWPDGTVQTDSLDILERIEHTFADRPPEMYKQISKAVDNVRCNIVRFKGVFPRNTLKTVHAPYLFRENGDLVPVSDHMVTLEETDEVLEEYDDGHFLCGSFVSAADVVWAPFLERYAAQLPLVHGGDALVPRSREYEALREWYDTMEELVPCYACRVAGDRASWAKVLAQAVERGNLPKVDLLPVRGARIPTNRKSLDAKAVWKQYAVNKPWMSNTPEEECVAFIVRHRDAIIADMMTSVSLSEGERDSALREVIAALLDGDATQMSTNARDVAAALEDRLMVPRDMGILPAATLRTLVAAAPKPQIST